MTQPIITVIGGSGFLGRYVVREMARAGWRVRVVCRRPQKAAFLKIYGELGQIQPVYGNLFKPETVVPHLQGVDAVVNLVGILFEKGNYKFSNIHTLGAEKIAQAAKLAKVPVLVHVSALGVNKAAGSQYARTKLLGENGVRAAFNDAAILRPSIIFGPEDNFFNQFAKLASFSPVLPAIGGGKTLFQPVWAADVARAIRICVENPAMRGKLYELGGPDVVSFRQILEFVLVQTGRGKGRFLSFPLFLLHALTLFIPCLIWGKAIASLPFGFASAASSILRFFPSPLKLTADQVKLLKTDNVVDTAALTFKSLGIEPSPISLIVPDYLALYRKGGKEAVILRPGFAGSAGSQASAAPDPVPPLRYAQDDHA